MQSRIEVSYALHITGASGAGVTTLGCELSEATGAKQLDTDDFYWVSVEPKYSVKRDIPERLRLLREAMAKAGPKGWILSGSIGTWGAPLTSSFNMAIYISAPTEIRICRLRAREAARFGREATSPGGARHRQVEAFVEWASQYDSGTREGRSAKTHAFFLAGLPCPVLRLDGARPIAELVAQAMRWLRPQR